MGFMNLFSQTTAAKRNAEKEGQQQNPTSSTALDPSKLSPLQQKQFKAREALKSLQRPPAQTGPQWTAEHHRILSENVRLLFEATSDPKPVVEGGTDDDEDDWRDEHEDRREKEKNKEGEDENGQERGEVEGDGGLPQGQPQSGQKQSTASPKSTRGKKRQREENTSNPDRRQTKDRPAKKSRLRSGLTQHVLEEFKKLKPQPLQLTFQGHTLEDRSDEWFIEQFRRLFRKIRTFAHEYFGLHDIDKGEFHQPWASGMTVEFLRHVENIAEADPMDGGWDKLLQNTIQREWLVVAIIMRILEIQVFGTDLWGADQQEKDLLLGLERAFFTREGFERTALRSNTARTIIGQGAITKNFHKDVTNLTAKVALLLKPLTFFLYSRPPKDGAKNHRVQDQYQALHNIIALAAYLSLCIRLSPTIFYFSNVSPNTPYDEDQQHSVDARGYTKSKEAVVTAYRAAAAAYQQKRAELEREIAKLKAAGKSDTSRVFRKAQAKLDAHIAAQPDPPGQMHEALTKIGVWPNISRFKPGTQEDDETATPLASRRGCRIFEVSKSAVVCYYGPESRAKRAEGRVRLEDFVEQKVKRYGKKERGLGKGVVFATAAAAAVGIPYLLYVWPASA